MKLILRCFMLVFWRHYAVLKNYITNTNFLFVRNIGYHGTFKNFTTCRGRKKIKKKILI